MKGRKMGWEGGDYTETKYRDTRYQKYLVVIAFLNVSTGVTSSSNNAILSRPVRLKPRRAVPRGENQ